MLSLSSNRFRDILGIIEYEQYVCSIILKGYLKEKIQKEGKINNLHIFVPRDRMYEKSNDGECVSDDV
jgi:hypothetical protein